MFCFLTVANLSVVNRVASGGLRLFANLAYGLYAALLLGLFAYLFISIVRKRLSNTPEFQSSAVFITGTTALLFMVLLPIATTRESIRYYAIPILLIYISLAIGLPYLFPAEEKLSSTWPPVRLQV
jgi:hypothetical protein